MFLLISVGLNQFATHGALTSAQRPFGTIPGYTPHVPHLGAIQDPHLQNIATQGAYKGLQPSQPAMLSDPYAGLRITSQSNTVPTSKPVFSQDIGSLPSTIDTQRWGLSNFVSQNPSMVTDMTPAEFSSVLSNQVLLNPPPAHSSKASSLGQRLPFSGDLFTRSTKSPQPLQYDPRSQPTTPVSSQSLMFQYAQQQAAYQQKSDVLMDNSMSYEAVSPATTPDLTNQHMAQQQQQAGGYLSLQELASISSTQQKLEVTNQQSIQKRPSPIVPDRQNKIQHKTQKAMSHQDLYNGPHVRQSPQQSPIGSPPLQMGSPQHHMPSSSIVQAPPPVQAPADSTTKPKKSRSKKKKDPQVNDIKSDASNMGQTYNQNVLNSQDISQRGTNADFVSNQGYMQNRSQQQAVYSSGNINSAQTLPMMSNPQNAHYKTQPQHSNYAKNVPSPNVNQSVTPDQARSLQQQSPMLGGYQQVSPSNSQSATTFTVSDALEMSRQAVFANPGMMEGFSNSDMTPFGMQESFSHQLGIDAVRRPEMYNGTEDGSYMNSMYGGQFVSPNHVLHMDVNGGGQSTTIDQDAFSTLMSDSYERPPSQEKPQTATYSLTVSVDAAFDDDLSHLAQPVIEKKDCHRSQGSAGQCNVPQIPPAAPKPQVKNASGGTSFMDSYLSFIQGKKPETLSSMSSAIIQNKPQLPKYIPEPPRPRRVEPDPDNSARPNNTSCDRQISEPNKVHKQSTMGFSDSDDTDDGNSSAVQKAISSLSHDNDNVKFSTNKTGGLTLKINLNKVKKAEENAKKAKQRKPAKPRSKKPMKEKKFGLKEAITIGESSGEEDSQGLVSARLTATRKAKENKGRNQFWICLMHCMYM